MQCTFKPKISKLPRYITNQKSNQEEAESFEETCLTN